MAPARYRGGRRRGIRRATLLRPLDHKTARPDQRSVGGRSRRAAADPQHSGPAVLKSAAADCRRGLDALDGMREAMTEAVRSKARPFFGICVGMQLMATRGKEHVTTDGFDWIAGDVEKISPREENLKIPHMGWNTLDMIREHPVLERLPLGPKGRHAYFVHSYHINASDEADVLLRADYGGPVTAIVGKDTAVGTQFHPEKSQRFGLALISNFLKWKP